LAAFFIDDLRIVLTVHNHSSPIWRKTMDDILLKITPPIAVITINRPDEQNLLNPDALDRLDKIIEELRENKLIHAVVLTGAEGNFFSAGLLNPNTRSAMTKEAVVAYVMKANRTLDALEALPQIVIAVINGDVTAGAVEIILACDIRLIAEDAILACPEVKWGGFPGAGGPVRLPGLVGRGRALEIIATGRTVRPDELLRIGLVEHVYPKDKVLLEGIALAQQIAENGPEATRGAKRIVNARLMPGFAEARTLSDDLRSRIEWSQDVNEGIAAAKAGRKPDFSGK
jgi:enoyl-CoA hydratase/carnithine racemase